MRRLQQRFSEELVIIGVHSAKFPAEKESEAIRQAAERHGIEHPVVNDRDFAIWQSYAVRAWPTIVLIDPDGYYVGSQSGEIDAEALGDVIEKRIADASSLRRERRETPSRDPKPDGLRYPSRVVGLEKTAWVADTGHHRLLEMSLSEDGTRAAIRRVFGTGRPGLLDGDGDIASFHAPHGIAVSDSTVFVADTDNHVIRAIDRASGRVSTVAGTGAMGRSIVRGSMDAASVDLRSPWSVACDGKRLFIAMAGSHQIWILEAGRLGTWAGNGREALIDGPRSEASFNQPSDLVIEGGVLYVADAEASAVRAILIDGDEVQTVVGTGLFDFGDIDGVGETVRLQHCTGLTSGGQGRLLVADSYNHKLKWLDPKTRRVTTLTGCGVAGRVDGSLETAAFSQPEGLCRWGERFLVADTNNHALRVVDVKRGVVTSITIEGLTGEA